MTARYCDEIKSMLWLPTTRPQHILKSDKTTSKDKKNQLSLNQDHGYTHAASRHKDLYFVCHKIRYYFHIFCDNFHVFHAFTFFVTIFTFFVTIFTFFVLSHFLWLFSHFSKLFHPNNNKNNNNNNIALLKTFERCSRSKILRF